MKGRALNVQLFAIPVRAKCEPVVPSNGIGRVSCGRLFYSEAGKVRPGLFAVTRQENSHFEVSAGGNWVGIVNDHPQGRNYVNNPFPFTANPVTAHGELWMKIVPVGALLAGYFQAGITAEHSDVRPGIRLEGAGGFVFAEYNGLIALAGSQAAYFGSTGSPTGQQSVPDAPTDFGLELRASDRMVRGWSVGRTDVGITTAVGPLVVYLRVWNDANGFKGAGTFARIVITKQRAIPVSCPGAASVRITANGVVQPIGAVGYLALVAGAGTWEPGDDLRYPLAARYEFFSGAALAGVLVADVSVPIAWGGDVMGPV